MGVLHCSSAPVHNEELIVKEKCHSEIAGHMIGSFWNLCRACPSMPLDKVNMIILSSDTVVLVEQEPFEWNCWGIEEEET